MSPFVPVRLIAPALLLALAAGAAAQEVYRSEDENGLVSFSDVATEGAVRLELPAVPERSGAAADQERMIEQQLAVAKALEESRLKREEARLRRLEAQAEAAPRTVYYREPAPRYVGVSSHSRYWGRWPGHGFKPGFGPKPGFPPHGPGYPGYPGHKPGHPSPPVGPSPGGSRTRPLPPLKPR